jgi:uncharacterized protein (DUF433 family)
MAREPTTAYPADRAAALAGVPKSTLHYWAGHDILVPSVSAEKIKLWSYADLMGLRTIEWLRSRKTSAAGHDVPPTAMPAIKKALRTLRTLDLSLWTAEQKGPTVLVDAAGKVVVRDPETGATVRPMRGGALQTVAAEVLDLMQPFEIDGRRRGPDLRQPRPLLRIVPGKLAGAPHIQSTRLETQAVHALVRRGFAVEDIAGMYPFTDLPSIREAIELEDELQPRAA